jgi:hypothetical protein
MNDGRPRRLPRAARRSALIALLVAGVSAGETLTAWATFTRADSATTAVSAHQLVAPTLSCGGVGVLQVTLNWTAPGDTAQTDIYGSGFLASGYELAKGSTPGGPYTTVVANQTGTSKTDSVTSGHSYYVVRTTKHLWKGPVSNERHVTGVLFLLATCS